VRAGVFCRYLVWVVAVTLTTGHVTSLAEDVAPGAWETTHDRPAVEIGGTISDDGGSGEIGFLAPLLFSEGRDLLFLGVDAKVFAFDPNDIGDTVYNAGAYLGYRTVLDNSKGVFGLWTGFDHMRTEDANDFTRAIAGGEYFGRHVIVRANAFVPLDNTSGEWRVASGGFINTYDEKIPSGFDAEIGLRLAVPMDSLARAGEFRVFAGGYDFIGLDDDGGNVFGGRGRMELDLYPFAESVDTRLSFEAGYGFDKHSGDQFTAGVKLAIPLGIRNKVESSHGKDPDQVALDSFGQDLFQPVRRNREPVSRIRLKDRRLAQAAETGAFTLSRICGGATGSLQLNGGLASSSIKQGALLGVIDPDGSKTPFNLNLGTMIAPDGRTLKQILAPKPDVVKTTLKFAENTVNFATQNVEPAAAVTLASGTAQGQSITDATVTIDGNKCSLSLAVQPALVDGLSMATVCGGKATSIGLNAGLKSGSIKQGAVFGTIAGTATALKLDLGTMVAPGGQTLKQLLAAKPPSLNSTFKFAKSKVDFTGQLVRPTAAFALSPGVPSQQQIKDATLTVKSTSCSLNLQIEEAVSPPVGLSLATVCGGTNAAISLNGGLASSSIKQGATLGTIEPSGASTPLKLAIASMVAPGGQTLAQLLSAKPTSLSSTFTFPQSAVNFATQTVQPASAVALATGIPAAQSVTAITLTVNSKSCSLNMAVKANPVTSGLTLATICGGVSADLPMSNAHGVPMGATTIRQGDQIGTIAPTTPLTFNPASMVDANGLTLTQLLASKPKTLNATLFLPIDLAATVVEPTLALANAPVQVAKQRLTRFSLVVNGTSCVVKMKNGIKPHG
jgi:hypothetical protein